MRFILPGAISGAVIIASFAFLAWTAKGAKPTRLEVWLWPRLERSNLDREYQILCNDKRYRTGPYSPPNEEEQK